MTSSFLNQEVPENGADVSHLTQVHSPFMFAGINLGEMYNSKFWSFLRHNWYASWDIDSEEKHVGVLQLRHRISVFGKEIGVLDLGVKAYQVSFIFIMLRKYSCT